MGERERQKRQGYALDDSLDLVPDRLPNLIERLPRRLQLGPERVRVMLDRELVVRDAVAEVQAGRDGQVGFEDERELREEAFPAGRGVRDEQPRLGGVVDLLVPQENNCINVLPRCGEKQTATSKTPWFTEKRTFWAVSTSSPICNIVVHMVPCPPAIVAVPWPLSNNLCGTTAPPSPNNRSRTPPTSKQRVVASSNTVKLGIEYEYGVEGMLEGRVAVEGARGTGFEGSEGTDWGEAGASRIFSRTATSSQAPQTVYTGTLKRRSPLKRRGNSLSPKFPVALGVSSAAVEPFAAAAAAASEGDVRGGGGLASKSRI